MLTVALALFLQAQADTSGPELWRGLTYGMTKKQAEAVMPQKDVDLLPNCRAAVVKDFSGDSLSAVVLRQKWLLAKNDCSAPILSSLQQKYGTPQRDVITKAGNSLMPAESYDTYVWKKDKLLVVYQAQVGGRKWNLTYRLPALPNMEHVDGL